jgi:putative peptidoglycan lipid II flippase
MTDKMTHRHTFSAAILMVSTLVSRILGFVKTIVIGAVFGASGTADVVNAVFQVPDNLRKLVTEGAFSAAFVPVLSASLLNEPFDSSRKIARNIFSFLFIILVPLIVLALVFARQTIGVLLPFPDPAKTDLAVDLFRFAFPYLLFAGISAFLMGVLNSHNRFVPSAVAPVMFSVTNILCLLLFSNRLGVFSLALGTLLGGLFQVLFQLPSYLGLKYDLRPDLLFNNPHFRTIRKQWLPMLLSASLFTVNQQVAFFLASTLQDGSASALSNALDFWHFPFGIFSTSITTVLFTRMSRQAASGDKNGLIDTLGSGLGLMLVILIPASLGFLLMGREIIAVALERGKFTPEGTLLASNVLAGYSWGLVPVSAFGYFQRLFYSVNDYKTPLAVSAAVVLINVLSAVMLMRTPLQVSGLAYANTIAYSIGLIAMATAARKQLGSLNGRPLGVTFLKVAASTAAMAGLIMGLKALTAGLWTRANSLTNFALVSGIILLSVGVTFAIYFLARIRIVTDLVQGRFK